MDLDWLIIGGGLHGVHIAVRLLGEAEVPPERVRIVDPGASLLERWRSCTATTGMTYLRSPAVHHLDINPMSLNNFAGKRKHRDPSLFAPPYDRPALDLFNSHCDQVVETYGLATLHLEARALHCTPGPEGVTVALSNGLEVDARRVVLAIGASDQPEWPDWAPRDHPRVEHIFAPGFGEWPAPSECVAVIGGGLSAAQVALRLLRDDRPVHLISSHALREHHFDSDPGWLGPKNMGRFMRERDPDRRRQMIQKARHRGSVPADTLRALRLATDRGRLRWHQARVTHVDSRESDLTLRLSSGTTLRVHRVLLATGFATRRPGGSMIDALVTSASLPCAHCGYPIVDSALRWHENIHVAGPLAELELGPVARNIAGARRAGDRLVAVARATRETESPATSSAERS